jgi:hypothetical protein
VFVVNILKRADHIMPMQKITPEIINAAIEGFEAQKTRLDAQIAQLRQMLDGDSPDGNAAPEDSSRKRKISAAARRRMAAGQRKRWAAIKNQAEAPAPTRAEPLKPKRRISEEGMKRIIAATKKRWAKVRAQKAAKTATAKKTASK